MGVNISFADVRRCWWEVEGRDNQRPFAEVMQAAADDVVKFFKCYLDSSAMCFRICSA